jgi:hypothetical protein
MNIKFYQVKFMKRGHLKEQEQVNSTILMKEVTLYQNRKV